MTLTPDEFEHAVGYLGEIKANIVTLTKSFFKTTNIDHFSYLNVKHTNSCAALSSDFSGPNWMRANIPLIIPPTNGFYLISDFPDIISTQLFNKWKAENEIDNILFYIVHHKKHVDIFGFGTHSERKQVKSSYINNSRHIIY